MTAEKSASLSGIGTQSVILKRKKLARRALDGGGTYVFTGGRRGSSSGCQRPGFCVTTARTTRTAGDVSETGGGQRETAHGPSAPANSHTLLGANSCMPPTDGRYAGATLGPEHVSMLHLRAVFDRARCERCGSAEWSRRG